MLASSFTLEFPLNDALPSTENARDRLLAKIFKIRKNSGKNEPLNDEDFSLLYAYGTLPLVHPPVCPCIDGNAALVTGQLSKEIREVVQVVESLFGVLDEDLLKLQ